MRNIRTIICAAACILTVTGCGAAGNMVSSGSVQDSTGTEQSVNLEMAETTTVSNPSLSLYSATPVNVYSGEKLIAEFDGNKVSSDLFEPVYPYSEDEDDIVPGALLNFPEDILSEDMALRIENAEENADEMDFDAILGGRYYVFYADALKEVSADSNGNFDIKDSEGDFELTVSCTSEDDPDTGKMYIVGGEGNGDVSFSVSADSLNVSGKSIGGYSIEIYDDINSEYDCFNVPDGVTEYNTKDDAPVSHMSYKELEEYYSTDTEVTEESEG